MDGSSLGRLPPELRNLIYGFTLSEPVEVHIAMEPGLLKTCRAIREEAELMFYAVNDFYINVREHSINHDICLWLKTKAGPRLRLIRSLSVHCEMPSITIREQVAIDEDEDVSAFLEFLQLMHLMKSLRKASLGRRVEEVVRFSLNGAPDTEPFESIDQMPPSEQDKYRGAKFLIVCLVHGEQETVKAVEEMDSRARIVDLDLQIQSRRKQSQRPFKTRAG